MIRNTKLYFFHVDNKNASFFSCATFFVAPPSFFSTRPFFVSFIFVFPLSLSTLLIFCTYKNELDFFLFPNLCLWHFFRSVFCKFSFFCTILCRRRMRQKKTRYQLVFPFSPTANICFLASHSVFFGPPLVDRMRPRPKI